jgi:hypothetical protein
MQRMTLYVSYDPMTITPMERNFGDYLTGLFGGFTVIDVEGSWRDPDTGIVCSDYSYRYEVVAPAIQPEYCRWAAEKAREVFQQKCVLVTLETVEGWFFQDDIQN